MYVGMRLMTYTKVYNTRMEAEHLWTIAVNDSSDCETKESFLEEVFFLPYQTNRLHISSVASERYPWHKLKDSVSALVDVVDGRGVQLQQLLLQQPRDLHLKIEIEIMIDRSLRNGENVTLAFCTDNSAVLSIAKYSFLSPSATEI